MARHRMPVARAPFWSTVLAGTAACAIVSGTWGLVEPVTMQGTPHAAVMAVREVQAADAYGCRWWPTGPAWVSDRTPDGLCHDGPHGEPYGKDSPQGLRYDSVAGDTAVCDTDASCAQYAYDHGWAFDEMTPESMVADRSRPYGWAAAPRASAIDSMRCWVEKAHSPDTAEVICGDKSKRPATDTADIGQVFATSATDPCGWAATYLTGNDVSPGFVIEPAGCN